ncbi:hypothetical protein [Paenibacillus sp. FSL H7-0331]|uniref:hypothetical protein n=1 Tax=Paenibacillus sp. FSL H7-0331 TaxID=1920421 RepID=UPI00096FF681|nr:hypothetical protein [Paenibacillus sp. FSL H7-0331]OMF06097.1 hypothetical protein BK127_31680 [Paenibacillus sp. FSL H7-0331]
MLARAANAMSAAKPLENAWNHAPISAEKSIERLENIYLSIFGREPLHVSMVCSGLSGRIIALN